MRLFSYKATQFIVCCILIICTGTLNISFAEDKTANVEIASSPNPVGSGARAIGMGGAFIAVADDATAASWNPGGLIQLELPEISFAGAGFHRVDDNTIQEANRENSVSDINMNYISAVYPFTVRGYNMVVSLNCQHLYDFNRKMSFPLIEYKLNYDYEQSGSLYALGIAYSVQVTPGFSMGLTLNIWDDGLYENQWEQKIVYKFLIRGQEFEARVNDLYSFSGINAYLGFLWEANDRMTIGGVIKTPFRADLTHEYRESINQPGIENPGTVSCTSEETLDMPMSYGIGFAYRFSDRFTASVDIYRTEWDDFVLKDAYGNETSPVTGGPASDIKPAFQTRTGAEYLIIRPKYVIPLRCGMFYDPAPAEGNPDDYFGFSIGTGIAWKRFVFDIAWQYRFGNDVGASLMKNINSSQDTEEHTVYSSVIIHF
ncbi:MAG: hypothetical protein GY795_23690 [Desulfobacterales bacterium]|nr:hypothetical protein [Desulfobacterales bacterium]